MKKLYLMILILLPIVFASCGDDAEGKISIDDSAPAKATDLKTIAGPGEVYLAWKNPSDPSFMYTKIEYIDSKGEKKYKLTPKHKVDSDGFSRDTIRGFANTEAQTLLVFTCTLKGTNRGAVEIKESPDTPAFVEVIKTIDIEADLGGISVKWKNKYPSPLYVILDYYLESDPTQKGTAGFKIGGLTESEQFIQLVSVDGENTNVLEGKMCVVKVTVEDEDNNTSTVREFKVTPKQATLFAKDTWSFPGYKDNSNEQTTGYSSQEALGEGASPNGRVTAMIDNNPNTFWHSAWKTTANFPHWFILDIGDNKIVTTVALAGRIANQSNKNNKEQKGLRIYTCSAENAIGDSGNWKWEDHGHFEMDPGKDAPHSYRLTTNPVIRYIKVYIAEEDKGTDRFGMLSEIDVYGVE